MRNSYPRLNTRRYTEDRVRRNQYRYSDNFRQRDLYDLDYGDPGSGSDSESYSRSYRGRDNGSGSYLVSRGEYGWDNGYNHRAAMYGFNTRDDAREADAYDRSGRGSWDDRDYYEEERFDDDPYDDRFEDPRFDRYDRFDDERLNYNRMESEFSSPDNAYDDDFDRSYSAARFTRGHGRGPTGRRNPGPYSSRYRNGW